MSIATPEIRKRAIEAYKAGKGTQQHIADLYGVHLNTFKYWLKDYEKEGRLAPRTRGHMHQALSPEEKEQLRAMVMDKNDMTLEEMRRKLNKNCSIMAIWRELKRQGLRYKKNSKGKRTKQGRHSHST